MRGQEKKIKSLTISGNVYLLHHHDNEIASASSGDIYLYLHNEEELYPLVANDYQIKGHKGYFKAKIFDGNIWCLVNNLDFFEDRIHQFTKHEVCFYTFEACKERLIEHTATQLYRTYRDHYSSYLHESNDFKGKKGNLKNGK
jgi:hypothetical protein